MKNLIIVDFSNFAFRTFFTHAELKNSIGIGTGMIYGFIQSLVYLISKYKWSPNQFLFALDHKPKHKFEIYPEYKANRQKHEFEQGMTVPLQIKLTKLIVSYLGLNFVDSIDQECDDVIYTVSNKCKNLDVAIISNDHDMNQCLKNNVKIMTLHKIGEDIFTERKFIDKYGIVPEDYYKVQMLCGCETDNVKGMRGIGEKSAVDIVKMNNWLNILQGKKDLKFSSKRTQTMFYKNLTQWNLIREEKLVRLNNVEIRFIKNSFNETKLKEWFIKLEFEKYLTNFDKVIEMFGKGRLK